MRVQSCDCLKSLFPASVAKDLTRLEVLQVMKCGELVEIISEAKEGETKMFVFSCLTSLKLQLLPNLKYLYPRLHTLELPVLQELHARGCELVTPKFQESHPEEQVLIQKVIQIPSLKKLSFCIGDTKVTWDRESGRLQFDYLERFHEVLDSTAPLYKFLDTLPTIEKLMFAYCSFEEMFSAERPNADYNRFLFHLKGLQLSCLENLENIGLEHSWLQPFSRNLQTLQVEFCNSLEHYLIPGTVSFFNLTHLEVCDCSRLLYLFTSSTAKSLARLKRVEIKWCESLKEIVSTERDDESREDEQIIFEQLQVLYLKQLEELEWFYPGNCTLRFPCLEDVYVIKCSSMKTFSPFNKIDHSTNWFSAQNATPQQECDLNSAAHRTFVEKTWESVLNVSDLSLDDYPLLQEIWQWRDSVPLQDLNFSQLHSLTVFGCKISVVLPFNLLPFLTNLEELKVENCDSVRTIFDVKTQDRIIMTTTGPASFPLSFALKKLTLWGLPNLENVWNEDPHGILCMQLLQQVYVDNCKCLTNVFPASVARDLVELVNLVVQDCEELITIVAEDNADPGGTNLELTFPCPFVRSLEIQGLPKFKYFYHCSLQRDMLKTFTHLEAHTEDQVCIEKCVSLSENGLKMICCEEFQRNLLHELKVRTLFFHIESDVLQYEILQQVPSITEKLVLCGDSLKEIFCLKSPNVDDTGLLSQVKLLRLESLPNLISIGLEKSWIQSFLINLETLQVISCLSLINLVPCTVSFSNLTCLEVVQCKRLLYLFTSSTAKSMAQLKRMEIRKCDSIEEIVSKEEHESYEDEIIFPQLNCLNLEDLPKLTSFYFGSLSFPFLEKLSVIDCDRIMGSLCPGTLKANKLVEVELDCTSGAISLEMDLKSTMHKTFLTKISESAESVSYLELKDRPDLQEIWHSSLSIQELCFSDLVSLIVDGCQFLSDEVLPFYLLPFLTKLETLEVRNCDSVKTIFDVKCVTQDRIMTIMGRTSSPLPFPLKNLTLSELPNLENVLNGDPDGILSMKLLQQVYVEKCKCLSSVFPASVAEDLVKLENLVVQHCEGLMTIVAEDYANPKGTNLELTFPSVVSLTLWDLQKFKYFYCCSLQGDVLKTVTYLQPHTENQVCIEKFTLNLEHLTLGENELKMIWHGEFQRNLFHKLKVLILLNFDVEFNVFAYGFLQQVPNIEKLEVSCGSLKEIFCSQSPSVDYTGLLSQLKVLSLEILPELETIGLENTLNEPFIRNLETLDVSSCSGLRNIAPSPVCFPNLTCLFVSECHQLENLFTFSTAKSLTRLKIMEIKCCESIKEIVTDGSQEDEIIFGQLLYLNIESLPNLTSFYKGSLSFPSLVQLLVINCHNMENLCAGTINADKLLEVKFQNNSDAIPLKIDLNSTILKTLHATAFDYLSSSSSDTNEDSEYGED